MVWAMQRRLGRQLLGWSALSSAAGVLLLIIGTPFWQGAGLQAGVWGVIDGGIALFGLASSRRRQARPDANNPEALQREARNLRRLLLINAALDVLYVAAGVAVVTTLATAFARGNGVGIIVQGTFLLFFDTFYALRSKPR